MPSLYKNPSGFIRAKNEEELYAYLKKEYFPKRFKKQPREQYEFSPSCVIDFFIDESIVTLIEVKNWFIQIKDMQQIMKYLAHATDRYNPKGFHFILIAGGIEEQRRTLLEPLGVEIIITKDILSY